MKAQDPTINLLVVEKKLVREGKENEGQDDDQDDDQVKVKVKLKKVSICVFIYSHSKNCPNVWPFCNVWFITQW